MDKMLVARRLINLRGAKRRERVAADLDISVSSLAMYESGKKIPRDQLKAEFANYYGVSIQSLFFDTDVHNMCTSGDAN